MSLINHSNDENQTLEEQLRPNKNLLITTIFSSLSSILFLIFISFLSNHGNDIKNHSPLIAGLGIAWLTLQIETIIFSSYMYFKDLNSSKDLEERAKFSYVWAIYLGFLIFVPLILYRSYYLSGGELKTVIRAKKDYQISLSFELYLNAKKDKYKIPINTDHKIKLVLELFKLSFIDDEERNTEIWRLLNDSTKIFEDKIDYRSKEVIEGLSYIIETY